MPKIDPTMTPAHSVRLSGVLDGDAALQLRPRLETLAAAPGGDVMVDLQDVSRIDGSGIAAIAFLFKRLAKHGRRLTVAANGQPLAMLHELGLAAQLGLPAGSARMRGLVGLRGHAISWSA